MTASKQDYTNMFLSSLRRCWAIPFAAKAQGIQMDEAIVSLVKQMDALVTKAPEGIAPEDHNAFLDRVVEDIQVSDPADRRYNRSVHAYIANARRAPARRTTPSRPTL